MDYFKNLDINYVCDQITRNTYYNLDKAIEDQTVQDIKSELDLWNFQQ